MSKAREKFKAKLRKQRLGPKVRKPKPMRRRGAVPVCSAPKCTNRSTYIVRPRATSPEYAGTFWAACDDCVKAVAIGAKASGIDADVIAYAALRQMTGEPAP